MRLAQALAVSAVGMLSVIRANAEPSYPWVFDSIETPKQFGIALDLTTTHGGAGPNAAPDLVKDALMGRNPPAQVDPERLKRLWSGGS